MNGMLPQVKRFRVFIRDNHKCVYCGFGPREGKRLHVDHRIPKSKGGTDDYENLVTACEDCNMGKLATFLFEGQESQTAITTAAHMLYSHFLGNGETCLEWVLEEQIQRCVESGIDLKGLFEHSIQFRCFCDWISNVVTLYAKKPHGEPVSPNWKGLSESFLLTLHPGITRIEQ